MNAPDSKASRRSNLDPALISRTGPLPVAWYLDRAWYEREMLLLFDRGPNYAGHELMVPQSGDYLSLPWMDDRKVLVRDRDGVNLLSNVCRHAQGGRG